MRQTQSFVSNRRAGVDLNQSEEKETLPSCGSNVIVLTERAQERERVQGGFRRNHKAIPLSALSNSSSDLQEKQIQFNSGNDSAKKECAWPVL